MTDADRSRWGYEIRTEDVLGAPTRVFETRPHHAGAIIAEGRRRPEQVYLVEDSRRLTFAEHESAVAAVRDRLRATGVRPGDRVMIAGANRIEFVVSFWAILRAGCVATVANAWWSAAELQAAIDATRPAVVIADQRRAELLPAGTEHLSFDEVRQLADTAPQRQDAPPDPVHEDDPALIVFTSGTTGNAKAAELISSKRSLHGPELLGCHSQDP